MIQYIFTITLLLIFVGCSSKKQIETNSTIIKSISEDKVLNDLTSYPQRAEFYTQSIPKISQKEQIRLYKNFLHNYFQPWNLTKMQLTKEDASWGFKYKDMDVYGENYRKISNEWFNHIIKLSNMKSFDTVRQKAITIRNSHLKVFPSNKPVFKRYDQAGEGFPFDYNENSSIKLNSPLFISHYSLDKAWAYVSSSFASGWIMLRDIATVNDKVIHKFQDTNEYFVAIKDNFPIYKNGIFREYVKLGTIFPIRYGKYITIIKDNTGKGYISSIDKTKYLVKFPIKFNRKNLDTVINQLLNKPYGWGGLFGERDCSLLTKDTLTPFGFALERNSLGQTKNGKYISLEEKSNEEKKELIRKNGKPFLTLLYFPGHIALYLGTINNEPIIFQALWGIRTLHNGIEGRHIVGKSIISSLELGKELPIYDKEKSLISKLKGIVLLSN